MPNGEEFRFSDMQNDAVRYLKSKWRYLSRFYGDSKNPVCVYSLGTGLQSYSRLIAALLDGRGYSVTDGALDITDDDVIGLDDHYLLCRRVFVLDQLRRDENLVDIGKNLLTRRSHRRSSEPSKWSRCDIRGFAYAWLNPDTDPHLEDFYDSKALRKRLAELGVKESDLLIRD